jgi:hypothetical protein
MRSFIKLLMVQSEVEFTLANEQGKEKKGFKED